MSNNILVLVNYVVTPAVIGVLNSATVAMGHAFSHMASLGVLQTGVLGAVQVIGAHLLCEKFGNKDETDPARAITNYFFAHVVSGATIYSIAAIAFKVGLIGSLMTVPTATCFILANFALSVGCSYLALVNLKDFGLFSNNYAL